METSSDFQQTIGLLGGEATIRARIGNVVEAHDALLKGLPADALLHLVSSVSLLEHGETLQNAVGISLRTLQRHKARPKGAGSQRLSVEQSNRAWRFAELFAHAVAVMGSRAAAEDWMNQPAIGLCNRKPIELLGTSAGMEAVAEYLTRLEYGVYT
ncbi:MAG: DUF2384 domain-containing protein [Wenzhouxiangella sp.]|nr:MAG: DUF2384 domain-containing protein [Wenzhouxiangella sp.]